MGLVVDPPQRLDDAEASPLLLQQDAQRPRLRVEVVLWNRLEHRLGQHHVPVLVGVVFVMGAVVYLFRELEHLGSLRIRQVSGPAHGGGVGVECL